MSAIFDALRCAASARRLFVATAIAAAAVAGATAPAQSTTESGIGTTVVTVRSVTGQLGQLERDLGVGDRVFLNELLETGSDSHAELQLDDDTKLALGPNGSLTLDDYVVGGGEGNGRVVLNVLKGAFRFITGENDKDAYRIDTPSATIGVLGTVFDLYVYDEDETLLLLLEGEVEICSRTSPGSMGGCKSLSEPNQIIYSCGQGVLSDPIKWSDTLLPDTPVTTAFPFLEDSPQIDPVKRSEYSQISDESAEARRLIAAARERCSAQ
ncbi:FecR family protein [Microbaculum sp. FT89]|uniref:FecR family protein n=1 Tax=Microbaculum sp. FT89 TaxID=3447298 RepID=UPI003F5297B5